MFEQGPMPQKATYSINIRTEEEDATEQEADLAKDKADNVRLTKTTPNFGRMTGAIEEPSKEGGASCCRLRSSVRHHKQHPCIVDPRMYELKQYCSIVKPKDKERHRGSKS